jgi:16S rRNA (adenine1518-N6/adenine1519-N6)-dimethyltransferase
VTRPRKRFGQHFLEDASVIANIVDRLDLTKAHKLLEIGPGTGALSAMLTGRAGRYVAIELDRDLIPFLKARFADMELISADVLKVDLDALLTGDDWRVVGNLPYNISSPLMVRLISSAASIRDMHFMVQRELALRLTATPGTKAWGRLTVLMQYHMTIEGLFDVAPEAFNPPPRVWSTVVRITPRVTKLPLVDEQRLDTVLRAGFSARRKRLGNAFRNLDIDWSVLDLDRARRPDQLSVAEFVALANALS